MLQIGPKKRFYVSKGTVLIAVCLITVIGFFSIRTQIFDGNINKKTELTRINIPEKTENTTENSKDVAAKINKLDKQTGTLLAKTHIENKIDEASEFPNNKQNTIHDHTDDTKVEEEQITEIVYSTLDKKSDLTPKNYKATNQSNSKSMAGQLEPNSSTKQLWRINAVEILHAQGGPQVAIVIDDAGIDKIRTQHAIDLAGPLTISFLTYATNLKEQVKRAKDAGHEIMTHVPMEPFNKLLDPGPNFLNVSDPKEKIRQNINFALSKIPESVGINNHMGSRFTSNVRGMDMVMEELRRRGLLFLDSRTSPKTVVPKLASKYQVPFVTRNVFLDHEPRLDFILSQLDLLEKLARKQGYAVAIAHPRSSTIRALSQWLPVVAEKGLELVPISSIVATRLGIPQNSIKLSGTNFD